MVLFCYSCILFFGVTNGGNVKKNPNSVSKVGLPSSTSWEVFSCFSRMYDKTQTNHLDYVRFMTYRVYSGVCVSECVRASFALFRYIIHPGKRGEKHKKGRKKSNVCVSLYFFFLLSFHSLFFLFIYFFGSPVCFFFLPFFGGLSPFLMRSRED